MVIVSKPTLELSSTERATLSNFNTVLYSFCNTQNGCANCPFFTLVHENKPCIINGPLDDLLDFLGVIA